jgi:hypothetical protein
MVVRVYKTRQHQMIARVDRLHVSGIAEPVARTDADDLVARDRNVDPRWIVPIRIRRQHLPTL